MWVNKAATIYALFTFSASCSPLETSQSPLDPLKYYTLSFGLLHVIPLLSGITWLICFWRWILPLGALWMLSTGSRPGSKYLIQYLLANCRQISEFFANSIVCSTGPSSQTLVVRAVLLTLLRQAGENISELNSFHDSVLFRKSSNSPCLHRISPPLWYSGILTRVTPTKKAILNSRFSKFSWD